MGFWSSLTGNYDDKYSNEDVEKMYQGWETIVILPDYEIVSHSAMTRGAATVLGGLVGFALTSGSKTEQRKITTTVRIADKGVVIENGTVEGKDLKIPWEYILSSEIKESKIQINLKEGEIITLYGGFSLLSFSAHIKTANYINDHACGVVEDGW